MPTREEMDAVAEQLEAAINNNFEISEITEGIYPYNPALASFIPAERVAHFDDLTDEFKAWALEIHVEWDGFSEVQRADVIQRVIDGREMEFWMDGIERWPNSMPVTDADTIGRAVGLFREEGIELTDGAWVYDENQEMYIFDGKGFRWQLTPEYQEVWDEMHAEAMKDLLEVVRSERLCDSIWDRPLQPVAQADVEPSVNIDRYQGHDQDLEQEEERER